VEEWFDAEIPRRRLISEPKHLTEIEAQLDIFLSICKEYTIEATCFVTGKLAERKPHLVRKLADHGHEIASHSYGHKMVCSMSPDEFRQDIHRSIAVLEDVVGDKVKGYRAPSWSINANIKNWFYGVLTEEGILYSSSVYPAKSILYGMPSAPKYIHKVQDCNIIEIPQQLLNLGFGKLGFAGGAYLRLFPTWFIKEMIYVKNRNGLNVFLYMHPWELKYERYPVKLSIFENVLQYYGVRNNLYKIRDICNAIKSTIIRMDVFAHRFES